MTRGGLNKSLDVNCNGSDEATAFGSGANAKALCVAIGAQSSAVGGIAIGNTAKANGNGSVAIGYGAETTNSDDEAVAIGRYAKCRVDSEPYRRIQFLSRSEYPIVQANFIGFGKKSLLDLIYPIDSIYISISSTNPGTIFGGTTTCHHTSQYTCGEERRKEPQELRG